MPKGYSRKDELLPKAQRLRAKGLTVREIGVQLGVPRGTVGAWLDPEHLQKQRQRRLERYAGTCIDCGKPTDGSCGYNSCAQRCADCSRAHQAVVQRIWTRETVIAAIQRWAAEHGRPPRASDFRATGGDYPAFGSVYGRPHTPFRAWADAVEAAGFPRPRRSFYVRTPAHLARLRTPRIPTETLIERLRAASEDGIAPSTETFKSGYELLLRRGIPWTEACELAGVQPRMTAGWRKRQQ